jgi:hypothetical protein
MGQNSRTSLFILLGCLLLSLFCAIYPIYVIRPFRAQGATELTVALAVLRIRPVLTALCVLAVIADLIYNWRWRSIGTIAGAALVCLLAVVKMGTSARAYPIRGMSYHHIVNDVVNNVAIVATY